MLRRAIIGSLLLVLAAPQASLGAVASPGKTCTKAGQTQVRAGLKYTCVKSGKKLVWSKGIKIEVAVPVPTTTAAPALPTFPKDPTSFDDLVENYLGIAHGAWSKSREQILSSTPQTFDIESLVGPNTKLIFINPSMAYDKVSRLFPIAVQTSKISVITFNFDDREWASNQWKRLLPNSDTAWIQNAGCPTRPTCWGSSVSSDRETRILMTVGAEIRDDNSMAGTLDAHEFTHVLQQTFIIPRVKDYQSPPTWIIEGQAHFAQHAAMYNDSYELYLKYRRSTSQELYSRPEITTNFLKDYFQVRQSDSWFKTYDRWYQYDLGAMFVEVLVALKGPISTMELWKQVGKGQTFNDAFESIFGRSFETALPIISKAIALQLGNN